MKKPKFSEEQIAYALREVEGGRPPADVLTCSLHNLSLKTPRFLVKKEPQMKEPGLDNRHRDKNAPKAGEIQQKRSDTLNKNLPTPIPEFRSDATLGTMRQKTGKVSVEAVRRAAKHRR